MCLLLRKTVNEITLFIYYLSDINKEGDEMNDKRKKIIIKIALTVVFAIVNTLQSIFEED